MLQPGKPVAAHRADVLLLRVGQMGLHVHPQVDFTPELLATSLAGVVTVVAMC